MNSGHSSVNWMLPLAGKKFGTTLNTKGYKVLPPYLRLIQGDGISYKTLPGIIEHLKDNKWSIENIAFGSGGVVCALCGWRV